MGILVCIQELYRIHSDVELVAQRRKSFDPGFPFLKHAQACIQIGNGIRSGRRGKRRLHPLDSRYWNLTLIGGTICCAGSYPCDERARHGENANCKNTLRA